MKFATNSPAMRRSARPAALLLFLAAASPAWALPTSNKALAEFEVGYGRCEKVYPPMRGHVDEAYAGVWKRPLDAKLKGQLAAARKDSAYASAKKAALARADKQGASAGDKTLTRECQAVWKETGLAPSTLAP